MKTDAIKRMEGQIAALEIIIGYLLDESPKADALTRAAAANDLEGLLLSEPLSDSATKGLAEVFQRLGQRNPTLR